MALSIVNQGKLSYVNGVYSGQTKPVLLGNKANSKKIGPVYLGFQFGDDNVKIKAFFDLADAYNPERDNNGFYGFIQAGRLSINGVPIPLDDTQRVFPVKRKMYSKGWWIDMAAQDSSGLPINNPFYPFNAKKDDASINEENLFFYPQPFGNLGQIKPAASFNQRDLGESLCFSLMGSYYLDNLPLVQLPNIKTDIVNQLISSTDSIGFRYNISQATINKVFDFFENLLRHFNQRFSPNYVVQAFTYVRNSADYVGFLIRGMVIDGRERIYSITYTPRDGPLRFTAFLNADNFNPADDTTLLNFHSQWYAQNNFQKNSMNADNIDLDFLAAWLVTMSGDAALGGSPISGLQRVGPFFLRRNNFKNGNYLDELIYIMQISVGNTSSWQLYPFDNDYYYELDPDGRDPLNIYTNYSGDRPAGVYTYDQLRAFLSGKGINLSIGDNDPVVLRYDFQANICKMDYDRDNHLQIVVYNGLKWSMSRRSNNKNSAWGNTEYIYKVGNSSQDNMDMIKILTDFYADSLEQPEIRKGFL